MINLNAPAEALEAFARYETMAAPGDGSPYRDALAGLAVSQWITGDKDGAVATYQRLIKLEAPYGDLKFVAKLRRPDLEKKPLAAVQAETLRCHPELRKP
jgi:hypothetical protein